MGSDTAVEDRDTDPLAGHAITRPGVRRPDLPHARCRHERRGFDRVELRQHDVVARDVRDVLVMRERLHLRPAEPSRDAADDRKPVAKATLRLHNGRGRERGFASLVSVASSRAHDHREVELRIRAHGREKRRADLGVIAFRLDARAECGHEKDGGKRCRGPALQRDSPVLQRSPSAADPRPHHPVWRSSKRLFARDFKMFWALRCAVGTHLSPGRVSSRRVERMLAA